MGLTTWLKQRLRKTLSFDDIWSREQGIDTASSSLAIPDTPIGWLRAYRYHPDVKYCANLRAGCVSSVPLRLWKRLSDGGRKEITKHDSLDLLEEVNPVDDTTTSSLLYRTELELCLGGNAIWHVDRSRGVSNTGEPRGIYLKPSMLVDWENIVVSRSWLEWLPFQTNPPSRYHRGQLILFRYPNPEHSIRGASPLSSVTKIVESAVHAYSWNAKWFKNGARPSFLLILPHSLTQQEREAAQRSIQSALTGSVDNAHVVVVLEGGGEGAQLKDMQINPKDSDWSNLCSSSSDLIHRLYGVPKTFDEKSSTQFWLQTLIPEMTMIANTITWNLLRMYSDVNPREYFFEFDTTDVPALRRSNLDKIDEISDSVGGPWLLPDEARSLLGLPPLPDDQGKKLNQPYQYQMKYDGKSRSKLVEEVRKRLQS